MERVRNIPSSLFAISNAKDIRRAETILKSFKMKARISAGEIAVMHVPDTENPSDFLTKWVPIAKLKVTLFGVCRRPRGHRRVIAIATTTTVAQVYGAHGRRANAVATVHQRSSSVIGTLSTDRGGYVSPGSYRPKVGWAAPRYRGHGCMRVPVTPARDPLGCGRVQNGGSRQSALRCLPAWCSVRA